MNKIDSGTSLKNSGFSLIELLVVIAIIGISGVIATISFNEWNIKSAVEKQIRQMAADINDVRVRALTSRQRHSITLNEFSYVFKVYSSETYTSATDLAANGTVLPGGSHSVRFAMNSNSTGTAYNNTVLEIDQRGMVVSTVVSSDIATVYLAGSGVLKSSVNCLKINAVRVNLGKQNSAGVCND